MNKFIENGIEKHPYDFNGVSGIYKIVNIANKKFYLGRANNIYNRFLVHRSELNKRVKSHKDSPLGRAWSKYGENSFYVEIVERVPAEKLKEVEQK